MAKLAPSLAKLRDEFNRKYPKRDKSSDGWIGDSAHSSRTSDHNPDARGIVHAIDVDKDLFPGSDSEFNALVEKVANDPRIKYTIWRRRIKNPGGAWRKYSGTNPHDKHAHFSATVAGENQTHSWLGATPTKPAPATKKRLTAGEIKWLAQSVGIPQDELSLATAIALAESTGDPKAYNGKGLDASYGLWQINTHGKLGPDRRSKLGLKSNDELFDPATNARAMKLVLNEAGSRRWKPWGAFTDRRYLEYLPEALAARPTPIGKIQVQRKEVEMFIADVNGNACLFEGGGIAVHLDSQDDIDRLRAAGIPQIIGSLNPDFADSHLVLWNSEEAKVFWGKKVAVDGQS